MLTTFGTVLDLGGNGFDAAQDIATDASGDMYVTGYFQNTVNFNPAGSANNVSAKGPDDIFIAKYAPGGALDWVQTIGAAGTVDQGLAIAVAPDGSVYTTGHFTGSVNFDNAGSDVLTANGQDLFVMKLDNTGAFQWAKDIGGSGDDLGTGIAISSDSASFYLTGVFSGTANFNPVAGTANLTSTGPSEAFVAKYQSDGTYMWADGFGGSSGDEPLSIAISPDNSGVYTTGWFQGSVDFNPGSGSFTLTSSGGKDAFINKLNSDGSFAWARDFGSTKDDAAQSVAVGSDGSVYIGGYFQGTIGFNPGTGVSNLTSAGNQDGLVAKLSSSGNYIWAADVGGISTDQVNGVAVDSSGNVYATGEFIGTADFNPNPATPFNITAAGSQDAFVLELASTAAFVSVRHVGGSGGTDTGAAAAIGSAGNVDVVGTFSDAADFDPTTAVDNVTALGSFDAFIASYAPQPAPTTTGITNVNVNENAASTPIDLSSAFADSYDGLTYSVTNDTNSSLFSSTTVSGSQLTLAYAPNTSGSANLTVQAVDSLGQSVSTTFSVTVNFVNQPPSFTIGPNETIPMNSPAQTFTNWATNISPGPNQGSETVSFHVTNTNSTTSMFSVQPTISPTGTLTFTPAAGASGTANFSVTLQNSGGGTDTSAPQTFSITIPSGPTTLTLNGRAAGDMINVGFSSANQFVVTVNGTSTTYSTSNVNKVVFNGANGGAESVVFDDPDNTYSNATVGLGTVSMQTSGFEFDANGVTVLYVYGKPASSATVTVPSGLNFFVGDAALNYDYIYGNGIYTEVSGFGNVTATGAGGSTYAYLYSASGASTVGSSSGTTMTSGAETVKISNFPQVYGVGASDGTDSMTLNDPGAQFVGTPEFSYITDGTSSKQFTFFIAALYYANVTAQASNSGTDTAFFDSYSGNTFTGGLGTSQLTGSDSLFSHFSVQANGFNSSVTYASGSGTDMAVINSASTATFVGTSSYSTLTRGNQSVEVVGYGQVSANGAGDNTDAAYLYDTAGSNTLTVQGSSAVMSTALGGYSVNKFGTVIGEQQSGNNDVVKHVAAIDYTLQTVGSWTNG